MKENQLYDLSAIKTISRGNEVFVQKMVDIFCDQTPVLISEMRIALSVNNIEKIKKIAHQLKPSIDGLAILELKQLVREIEHTELSGNMLFAKLDFLGNTVGKVITQLRVEYPAQR